MATPQSIQSKRWCFTLNNPTEDDIKAFSEDRDRFERLIFQEEMGENGTPHLQGAFTFKKKQRADGVLRRLLGHKRTHLEVMRGELQDQQYCNKEDTYIANGARISRNWPEAVQKMEYNMLRDEQKTIADEYQGTEDALFGRTIDWYWESQGKWGKSILTKYMVDRMGALVIQGANKDCLYTVAQYCLKNECGPKIVIFDIPRCNAGAVSYQAIESLKNGCFNSPKYESGMIRMNSPWILVFSNVKPDLSKLSEDRWNVISLRPGEDEGFGVQA